jgi:hypothetical protein
MYRVASSGLSGTARCIELAAGICVILNASRYVTVSKEIEHTLPPD